MSAGARHSALLTEDGHIYGCGCTKYLKGGTANGDDKVAATLHALSFSLSKPFLPFCHIYRSHREVRNMPPVKTRQSTSSIWETRLCKLRTGFNRPFNKPRIHRSIHHDIIPPYLADAVNLVSPVPLVQTGGFICTDSVSPWSTTDCEVVANGCTVCELLTVHQRFEDYQEEITTGQSLGT